MMIALLPAWLACLPQIDVSATDSGTTALPDTDADTEIDWGHHPGKAGALGRLRRYEFLGTYWSGGSTPDTVATSWWQLIDPADFHSWEFSAPEMDSCATDYQTDRSLSPLVALTKPSETLFSSGTGASVEMSLVDGPAWENSAVDPADVRLNTTYSLEKVVTDVLPDLAVETAVSVPSALELLDPGLDTSSPPGLRQHELEFSWVGAEDADWVEIGMYYFTVSESDFTETVSCVSSNDGYFKAPSGLFSEWDEDDYVVITVSAISEGDATLLFNGSEFRAVGDHTQSGAIYPKH